MFDHRCVEQVDKNSPGSVQQQRKSDGELREAVGKIGVNSRATEQAEKNAQNVNGIPPHGSSRRSKMKGTGLSRALL